MISDCTGCTFDWPEQSDRHTAHRRVCGGCGQIWGAVVCRHSRIQVPCPVCGWMRPGAYSMMRILTGIEDPRVRDDPSTFFDEHDLVSLDSKQVLATHPASRCAGSKCCIHNPSYHPLRTAPLYWNSKNRTMYRRCSHGHSHPDPDHIGHMKRVFGIIAARVLAADPTCDGCCRRKRKAKQ